MLSDGTTPSPSQLEPLPVSSMARGGGDDPDPFCDSPTSTSSPKPSAGISHMSLGTSFNGTVNGSVNTSTASNAAFRQEKLHQMAQKLKRVEAFAKEVKLKAMEYIANAQRECDERVRAMQIDVSAVESKLKRETMKAQLEIKSLHLESNQHAQDLERQLDMYQRLQDQFHHHKSVTERREKEVCGEREHIQEERRAMERERQEEKARANEPSTCPHPQPG